MDLGAVGNMFSDMQAHQMKLMQMQMAHQKAMTSIQAVQKAVQQIRA